jgi:hypothetical protein
MKNAHDQEARQRVKAALAQRVHSNEGLDVALCNEALDVLDAAMLDGKNRCRQCGKELQEDWVSCPFCGAGQRTEQPKPVPRLTPSITSAAQASAVPQSVPAKRTDEDSSQIGFFLLVIVVTMVLVVVLWGIYGL